MILENDTYTTGNPGPKILRSILRVCVVIGGESFLKLNFASLSFFFFKVGR